VTQRMENTLERSVLLQRYTHFNKTK